MEWSEENFVKPEFYDETNVSDEYARSQITMHNRDETQFYEDLNLFTQTEMDEIIGSNIYVNNDEVSKNLFVEQQKKKFKDGALNVDFPFKVKSKDGSVIKILKTIEEWAEHTHWMMAKSAELTFSLEELIKQKVQTGQAGDEVIVSDEDLQKIANSLDIDVEMTSDISSNPGIVFNNISDPECGPFFNIYEKDNVGELSIDEAKIGLSKKYDIPVENIEVILKG